MPCFLDWLFPSSSHLIGYYSFNGRATESLRFSISGSPFLSWSFHLGLGEEWFNRETKRTRKMAPVVWEKPVKTLDQALSKIYDGCETVQFEHRLDPYSSGVVDFRRNAGDKIANPHLGDDGVKKICQALEKNTTVKALDLSGNRIGNEGVEAICKLLKKNDTIEVLYLEDNRITDTECELLADKLRKHESLRELSLSGNRITSKGAKAIATSLRKNKSLEALWLNRNSIRDGGAKMFGTVLRSKNNTLDTLCLEGNKIRERGAKVLAKGVRKNTELKTLNLGGNKIGSKGVKYFDKAIKKNEKAGGNLKTIVLDGNRMNQADLEVLSARADGRKVTLQGRTHYDIYGNEIEHRKKAAGMARVGNYLKYHTKWKYLKQGHFDPEDQIEERF